MVNYFYNITSKEDKINFFTDVFTSIRKEYYLTKDKVKGKITQNSSLDCVHYDFSIANERAFRWNVTDSTHILSDCKVIDDGKYCVSFYGNSGLYKQLTFSKFHTLLKVEYYNKDKSSTPCVVIEPRKSSNGLCLLLNVVGSYQSVILFPMPHIDDEFVSDKIEMEFEDYSAIASTDDGVIKFLDTKQLEEFEKFVEKTKLRKEIETAPERFIDESEAVLAKKLNPKDFNVKRNLSETLDITQADEFSYDTEDYFDNAFASKVEGYVDDISNEADLNIKQEFVEITADNGKVLDEPIVDVFYEDDSFYENISLGDTEEYEPIVSTFVEYTQEGMVSGEFKEETLGEDLPAESSFVEITADNQSEINESEEISNDPQIVEEAITEQVIEQIVEEAPAADITSVQMQNDVCTEFDGNSSTDIDYVLGQDVIPDRVIENGSAKYMYYGDTDAVGNRVGFGRTTTDDGHTAYEGNYENNKRNGIGAYYYKDGELCYYGNWKDNKREGFGIGISSFDKSVHIGSFKNNKPDGDGARVDSFGNVRFVTKTLSNGMTVMLEFDDDKVIITKYNENGEVISENSSNLKYF